MFRYIDCARYRPVPIDLLNKSIMELLQLKEKGKLQHTTDRLIR